MAAADATNMEDDSQQPTPPTAKPDSGDADAATAASSNGSNSPLQEALDTLQEIHTKFWRYRYHLLAIVLSISYVKPSLALWILAPIYTAFLKVLAVFCGLGIGLGYGIQWYDQYWEEQLYQTGGSSRKSKQGNGTSSAGNLNHEDGGAALIPSPQRTNSSSQRQISSLDDEQTYPSLMRAAGYFPLPSRNRTNNNNNNNNDEQQHYQAFLQRGQVVPMRNLPLRYYTFDDQNNIPTRKLQELWPTLPSTINEHLGIFVDLIVRDFVGVWYTRMDPSVEYPNNSTNDPAAAEAASESDKEKQGNSNSNKRVWLGVTGPYQKMPFLEHLYHTMAIVFGNLATRVEHVNVMQVALLQWVRVLAHTFKWYRHLRKSVQRKALGSGGGATANASSTSSHRNLFHESLASVTSSAAAGTAATTASTARETARLEKQVAVTEMMMTREFLLNAKLHKAVVFGLDIPALLFADADGSECGGPTTAAPLNGNNIADHVLEQRLFHAATPSSPRGLVEECELDYHRSLGHRITRALLPRHEFESTLVSSLVTEILAGSVLTPLMSCFTPDYINGWLVQGLSPKEAAADDSPTAAPSPTRDAENQNQSIHTATSSNHNHSNNNESETTDTFEDDNVIVTEATLLTATTTTSSATADAASHGAQEARSVTPPPQSAAVTKPIAASTGTGPGVDDTVDNHNNLDGDIVTQLAMALIDLQQFLDFDDLKNQHGSNRDETVATPDWDNSACQSAVIRLVLVVEAALQHGRCTYRVDEAEIDLDRDDTMPEGDDDIVELGEDSDRPVEVTLNDFESATLSQLLMELTSDLDAFEQRVAAETPDGDGSFQYNDDRAQPYVPSTTEQSTLRTLIAAWLHTGHVYRTIMVLCQAHSTFLAPYYHSAAFLRGPNAASFCRQLRALDKVYLLVDTMTVLSSPRLEEAQDAQNTVEPRQQRQALSSAGTTNSTATPIPAAMPIAAAYANVTPRHFDFHRNEAFASSLRSERERRAQSWDTMVAQEKVEDGLPTVVCHNMGEEHVAWHRELHHVAKIFYSGTNLISVRDAARKAAQETTVPVSLLTVEMASSRRRIEVPDDDSSFLLRAQPRPLNAVGVHRDSRNHDLSFKCFSATFEEPVVASDNSHYVGGRFIRRCLIRYFPIDRTATVALQNDARKLDQRKMKGTVPDTITLGQSRVAPSLSADFLRERHLCQRWAPKGTNRTQSLLASSVMESTDFTSMPRSGRAIDFLYRMSFFERPMVDLGGKHFTVHDSGAVGTHRADASSLEMSDAALSATLLAIGAEVGSLAHGEGESGSSSLRHEVEMGKDGYPIIWMKFNRKQEETQVEVKPYRLSFVRAALLMTSARVEAQLQSLTKCVQAGSAKKATKALTDDHLRPALRLLQFAGNGSREKQSILLRDLKLGVNHIDRTQLRRNGLLLPRYPTRLLDLTAAIEDAIDASEVKAAELFGTTGIVYKIRLFAKVDLVVDDADLDGSEGYRANDGSVGKVFLEEWVVYRSFKEFQAIHKHLKNQVSVSESSGTAGSRLVGAASAAFTAHGTSLTGRTRTRKVLIPSMSQAGKVGGLGITKKSVEKRRDCLNEYLQYILSRGHLLSRCPELLLFLGAFYPLLPQVRVGEVVSGIPDPLGRTEMTRSVLENECSINNNESTTVEGDIPAKSPGTRVRSRTHSHTSVEDAYEDGEDDGHENKRNRTIDMIPAIRNKIDKVPLSQVRNRIFELLKYQFGFENASFARNRMLAALKTASFAVTSGSEFRRTLYKLHKSQLSADAVAGWIKFTTDLLWPGGVFFESSPPLSESELREQSEAAREALHNSFPEALRAILGQELTHDGLEVFYEMLQNRMVVKSMVYMLFDLLWLEVFPEIGDILQCGGALDIDP